MVDTACAYDYCDRPAKLYACGYRCADHTPAKDAGRPEPPDMSHVPKWWYGKPVSANSTSWLYDKRAVESGRRVSGERRRVARSE